MAKIDAFFKLMHENSASDLHLVAGQPPALRINGDIERVKFKVLDTDELRSMLYEITAEDKVKVFEETGDVDFAYEIPGLARYRANFSEHRRRAGIALGGFQAGHFAPGTGPGDRSHGQRQIHYPGRHYRCGQRRTQRPYHYH